MYTVRREMAYLKNLCWVWIRQSSFSPQQPFQFCALFWWAEECWQHTHVLAGAEQHWHSIRAASPSFPPSPVGWRWARSWEGTQLGQLIQADQRNITFCVWSEEKAQRRKRGERITSRVNPHRTVLPILQQ